MKVKAAVSGNGVITLDDGVRISYLDLQEIFIKSLRTLTKSDCIYLSRTMGVSERTIRNWRDWNIIPRELSLVFETISWVQSGKCTIKIDDEEMIPWLN